jgi:hypothetical protein
MRPYAAPLPSGATPPPRWGDEQHVSALFGEAVTGLRFQRRTMVMDHRGDPADFREYWKRTYGPTIATYRYTASQPNRVDDLDRDFLNFLTTWNRAGTADRSVYHAEYLQVVARKREQ